MWKDCLNSETTFWVLLVLDIIMAGLVAYAVIAMVKKEREFDKQIAKKIEYVKYLETLKNNEL
jgi:hypothetical protein